MPELTLITTSPFPGQEQLREVTFPSLLEQTCRDFTWMYLDGCYGTNRDLFAAFAAAAPFEVVHLPLMHDNRTPRKFHWEPYNSALLVCRTKYFLRWGRFRRYHPSTVEESLSYLRAGYSVDFAQRQSDNDVKFHEKLCWYELPHPTSSCGMFGMAVDTAIHVINGNDEVGLHQNHFEDVEMNGRMKNMSSMRCMKTENGLTRLKHNKDFTTMQKMDTPAAKSCGSPGCPHVAPGFAGRREAIISGGHCDKIVIGNMDFWSCRQCGAMAPGDADEYRDWVHARGHLSSLIGVNGNGRNLAAIAEKLSRVSSLTEKISIVESSYGK